VACKIFVKLLIFWIVAEDKTTPTRASIEMIFKSHQHSAIPSPTSQSISVDVMIITGTTATSLSQEQTIFYDTEILAIVYRSKSLETGLVSTMVWGWQGKRGNLGEREQRKIQDLAKRYGTTAVSQGTFVCFRHEI
jgi:hypothetical protein